MSVSTTTLKRLDGIKEGLIQGLNREQIGEELGVSERTIRRDVRAWVESGLFETWLKEEFLRLHVDMVHENPELAYVQVSKLVGHMLTRKIEKKEQIEISEEIVTVNVTENEDEILSKAASILSRKDRFNKIH
jgi:DNA-binding transcriptional regulator LsrR (DeoR family)